MLLYREMPQTKSAKKALRREKRRERIKSLVLLEIKKSLVLTRRKPDLKNLRETASVLDQAAKKGVIHHKKAARLKSRLAKLVAKTTTPPKTSLKRKRTKK